MNVLVDTSVWSLLLRRRKSARLSGQQTAVVAELKELLEEDRAYLTGVIRQELLTGIRKRDEFEELRTWLRFFDDLPVSTETHELAADFANRCSGHGLTIGTPDILICAVAYQTEMATLTTDKLLAKILEHLELSVYEFRQP